MRHPGELLQEKLNNSGMSRKELALRTNVTEKHICTIVNGNKDISTAFARKLGYVFPDSKYWLNLQAQYDAYQASLREEYEISLEEMELLKPLRDIMAYFIDRGYMHNNCGDASKVIQLREFLQISDLTQIPKITYNAAYRAQLTTNVKVDPYVLFAWQRLCEKETESISINKSIDKDLLRRSVGRIKKAMFGSINKGIQEVQGILAECGIAFQVVQNFRGAPVQGFIKETASGRLILCLTIRGKRADRFWFTLFHEIAHILNGDNKTRFVDFDSVQGKAEQLADQYASDTLISPEKYRKFILSGDCTSWDQITAFAEAVEVKPFIVLGRLQNDGYVDWSDYTDKVVRYDWA
ncbi:MAG: ImmA/IrrE family metallo-endopeptidase [Oscillospiraceae bacterium]|nr:ImmA/IrrE family metallo-endopeptidase [Oscillospiraceae bacterium]